MIPERSRAPDEMMQIDYEKVAYWYFRLNGFLQIENFVIHPDTSGSQRTEADLLGVRFPFRAEGLFDNPDDTMADDYEYLDLSGTLIEIVITEIKKNQMCQLNRPWKQQKRQNVHRALAAIGCFSSQDEINAAAESIYDKGGYQNDMLRIRLMAVGRECNEELSKEYPQMKQLLWKQMLTFIWTRFHDYRDQKTQVNQWDCDGSKIKELADQTNNVNTFIKKALDCMRVRNS